MTGAAPRTVGRKVADGAGLLIALRIAERLVGLASFSILARFLAPSDFGLLALATSVIAVVELFGQAGINLALIQRRSASRAEYDTAWTIDVLVGAVQERVRERRERQEIEVSADADLDVEDPLS